MPDVMWSRKSLLFNGLLLLATLLLAAGGKAPWVIPAFIGIVFLINLVPWIRGGLTDPLGAHETGHIVAVDIVINRKAWYMGASEPLGTAMIMRTASGAEEQVPTMAGRMPKAVRQQVFSSSFVILTSSWSTNLEIKDPTQRANAIEQARHGGYRFDLPQPVRVQFQRSQGGRLVVGGV